MKCQKCEKSATFHITELTGGKPEELHFCEDCAKGYLRESEPEEASETNLLKQQLAMTKTVEELDQLDQRSCPVCGITFYEFRNQGRLGCPHDYVCFERELAPLFANIHGESQHTGKRPKAHHGDTDRQTDLIRLRRELKEAVATEDYEQASQLRDQIRSLEGDS